ncbi:membrane protein [Noumeavirus]|uniref:membrane protein n=1 Tax=Noumeavirus TaxID=1955558 RepID=UPI000982E6AB|nr:membrane protein [Noumeavirus]AQM72996.1 membrane protein [Noumeavirus]
MTAVDIPRMGLLPAVIASVAVSGIGLYNGFKHGIWTACACYALGPAGLSTFSSTPVFPTYIPTALGISTIGLSGFAEFTVATSLFGFAYTLGALVGGSLVGTPNVLLPFGIGFVLMRLVFS